MLPQNIGNEFLSIVSLAVGPPNPTLSPYRLSSDLIIAGRGLYRAIRCPGAKLPVHIARAAIFQFGARPIVVEIISTSDVSQAEISIAHVYTPVTSGDRIPTAPGQKKRSLEG